MPQKIKFYMDEHVPKAVVRGLRERGVDVLTVTEAGTLGMSDEAHLQRAIDEGRTVFSQDTDFLRLHSDGIQHPGIVYAPPYTSVRTLIQGLMLVYEVLDADEISGTVEFL